MAQRPPTRASAPAEIISGLNGGYNGYTDPILLSPKAWAPGTFNVFSGAFGYIQRARFANVFTGAGSNIIQSSKYFALPGLSSWLMVDYNNQLFSLDTNNNYSSAQRFNPYVDPTGVGNSLLSGPWSREPLGNILYEMNGQVKQAGRLANASTIEGFGLDAPDASPQVILNTGVSVSITAISRSNGIVTATMGSIVLVNGELFNVTGVVDPSFNGTFVVLSGGGAPTTSITWSQPGLNTTPAVSGTININISKNIGRSYAGAWENANKGHVSAPSPATQFILYNNQNGTISFVEPGTITTVLNSTNVVGVGTFFTSAWVGRSICGGGSIGNAGRIASVQSPTQLTLAVGAPAAGAGQQFQIFDPQATHFRLYQTGDGQATYFRTQRNVFNPSNINSLSFIDNGNSEPPNFPFTTETSQLNNVPPPIGAFINEYQGRLCVYGVPGQLQSFFYSNVEATGVGLQQESFAPLNQITLPIANGKVNGMLEFPGSLIVWSDKQDMFRVTGLLSDNVVSNTPTQQGSQIARLPYNLGSASPFASDITPLGGIWLSSNGEVWLYTDRYAPRNIGRPVQDILDSIPRASLSLARAKYYHTSNRNWFVLAVPSGANFNNTLLILDLELLASNGSPSYFTFDMATNQPTWYVFQTRADSLEAVIEQGGLVRLLSSPLGTITDVDFRGGFGSEIPVNGTLVTQPWGNDHAHTIKRPGFIRFKTNQDPTQLAPQGWSFVVNGIDDDFYTLSFPLSLTLAPGVNDMSSLAGNPDLATGESFRHSPEVYRIGGVNFVAGRRFEFQVNFPNSIGTNFQFNSIQFGFGVIPPR